MYRSLPYLSRILRVNQHNSWPKPSCPDERVNAFSNQIIVWLCSRDKQVLRVSDDHIWDVCDEWLTTTDYELLSLNQRYFIYNLYLCTLIAKPDFVKRPSPSLLKILYNVLCESNALPTRAVLITLFKIQTLHKLFLNEFSECVDKQDVLFIESVVLSINTTLHLTYADNNIANRIRQIVCISDEHGGNNPIDASYVQKLSSLARNFGMHKTALNLLEMNLDTTDTL